MVPGILNRPIYWPEEVYLYNITAKMHSMEKDAKSWNNI